MGGGARGFFPTHTPGMGIQLKHGKGVVSQVITAVGHQVGADVNWAGLQLTAKRQAALPKRITTALDHGFKECEDTGKGARLPELTGHVNFGIQAVGGPSARVFARTSVRATATGLRCPRVVGGNPNKTVPPHRTLLAHGKP